MRNSSLTKPVVGGKYKGKKLKLPQKDTTRSTKSIVLESFFNTVQFDIVDAVFVEVFGGSGSMGIEALSRGAKEAFFIEIDRDAYNVLRENLAMLHEKNATTYFGDSFKHIDSVKRELQEMNKKAIFYLDPPFAIRENYEDIYKSVHMLILNLPKEITQLIAIEHQSGISFEKTVGSFEQIKSKKFGKTSLTYFN